jgi:hypothetical protein
MIPYKLQQLLSEKDIEDIEIRITNVYFENVTAEVSILFSPNTYYYEGEILESQTWKIKIFPVVEYNISSEAPVQFEILENHPFINKNKAPHGELYFSGHIQNKHELISALLLKHFELIEGYELFGNYYMSPLVMLQKLDASSALLANAPLNVLKEFKKVLDDRNIKNNIIQTYVPKYWNGYEQVSTIEKLKILAMSDTYFIAENFEFY